MAPYEIGDRISVLYYNEGTCMSVCKVASIAPTLEHGKWQIQFRLPNEQMETVTVNHEGRDKHGYVVKMWECPL